MTYDYLNQKIKLHVYRCLNDFNGTNINQDFYQFTSRAGGSPLDSSARTILGGLRKEKMMRQQRKNKVFKEDMLTKVTAGSETQ